MRTNELKSSKAAEKNEILALELMCQSRNGESSYQTFYIGSPKDNANPVHFQASHMKTKGLSVEKEAMDALGEMRRIGEENGHSVVDVYKYMQNIKTERDGNIDNISDKELLEERQIENDIELEKGVQM